MLVAVADTHAVIWYIFADRRLSETARAIFEKAAVEGTQVAFSSITLAEIVYLSERGRIPAGTLDLLLNAVDTNTAVLVETPFDRYITQTMATIDRAQVPDLPDRIISATAVYLGVPLISRDHKIQLSIVNTIW
jgi:PIN domain nuclease of toxin-antitoxin system